MKAVMLSVQPKWCELIASGKKTVEVRKTRPKLETPFKVYIYCSQGAMSYIGINRTKGYPNKMRVIGEFVCDQIDEIGYSPEMHGKYISDIDDIHYVSCVDFEQMFDYLADGFGYGWHISDLAMYEKPKKLEDFWHIDKCPYNSENGCTYKGYCFNVGETNRCGSRITRPPMSWCYVKEADNERKS